MTSSVPDWSAAASSAARPGRSSSAPVGLWKSTIRYANWGRSLAEHLCKPVEVPALRSDGEWHQADWGGPQRIQSRGIGGLLHQGEAAAGEDAAREQVQGAHRAGSYQDLLGGCHHAASGVAGGDRLTEQGHTRRVVPPAHSAVAAGQLPGQGGQRGCRRALDHGRVGSRRGDGKIDDVFRCVLAHGRRHTPIGGACFLLLNLVGMQGRRGRLPPVLGRRVRGRFGRPETFRVPPAQGFWPRRASGDCGSRQGSQPTYD